MVTRESDGGDGKEGLLPEVLAWRSTSSRQPSRAIEKTNHSFPDNIPVMDVEEGVKSERT